ncbi:MAG: acyltransferase domain-containing protein [Pseudomonadota bacterium]
MSARLLILCPGQGSQHAGMFDMARGERPAQALLERLALPPLDDLFANRSAQPLVLAGTLAMWEAVRQFAPTPALVAGYSIGELSAYAVAGALDPAEAVALAGVRAGLMDACVSAPQALLAISGSRVSAAARLLAPCGFEIAIVTAEDSCIAGGLGGDAQRATNLLRGTGAHVTALPVAVASHTSYMAPAVQPFLGALQAMRSPALPVLAGIDAARITSREAAITALARQLSETIVWSDCMDACAEAGITVALELGPGAALSRMLQTRHPGIACRSVAEFRSIDAVAHWLERQCA